MKERRLIEKMTRLFEKKYRLGDIYVGNRYVGKNTRPQTMSRFSKIERYNFYTKTDHNILTGENELSYEVICGVIKYLNRERLTSKFAYDIVERGWNDNTKLTKNELTAFRKEMLEKYHISETYTVKNF